MESYTYEITLADGTVLSNLHLNGNNFISDVEITNENFEGKLDTVTIVCSNGQTEELNHVELVQIQHYSDGYYFILRELSPMELKEQERDNLMEMLTDCILEMSEMLYS